LSVVPDDIRCYQNHCSDGIGLGGYLAIVLYSFIFISPVVFLRLKRKVVGLSSSRRKFAGAVLSVLVVIFMIFATTATIDVLGAYSLASLSFVSALFYISAGIFFFLKERKADKKVVESATT
jgi:drug/metabolite transporter (DMT)-like permease